MSTVAGSMDVQYSTRLQERWKTKRSAPGGLTGDLCHLDALTVDARPQKKANTAPTAGQEWRNEPCQKMKSDAAYVS